MDEDLKRVADTARNAEAGYGHCGEGLAEGKDRQSAHRDALKEFIATFDPPTVLNLLSRLSAAAERERVLVEALRPFAKWADRMPEVVPEFPRDISKVVQFAIANGHLTGAHFRAAAQALQAKEPT
jgi:hypothetical protein